MRLVYVMNPADPAPQYFCRVPRFLAPRVVRFLRDRGNVADWCDVLTGL